MAPYGRMLSRVETLETFVAAKISLLGSYIIGVVLCFTFFDNFCMLGDYYVMSNVMFYICKLSIVLYNYRNFQEANFYAIELIFNLPESKLKILACTSFYTFL